MKKIKKGFSLAEILIAVGIISVIATIGFSITTKGIDKAYDLYIYNGYNSLTNAIKDVNARELILDTSSVDTPFFVHLTDLFDGNSIDSGNQIRLETNQKINYIFNKNTSLTSQDNTKTPDRATLYQIIMEVPVKKQRDANNRVITSQRYIFYYVPEWYDTIFPANNNSLIRRKDLLPTYIDDGIAGHVIDNRYNRIVYRTFNDSICQTLGNLSFSENHIVTRGCPNLQLINGVIRIVNPRKVF